MRDKNKDKKKFFGIFIGIVILVGLIGFAMYFSTNKDKIVGTTDDNGNDIKVNLTITATPQLTPVNNVTNPPQESTVDKFLTVYMDKNLNQDKDQNELNCGTTCINKEVLLADGQNPNKPQTAVLNSQGKLNATQVGVNSLVWGLFADKNLLITPTSFAFGDGVGDIMIPAWDISGIIAGINANIVSATDEDNGIVYRFDKLIPMMKTAANSGKKIWVKLTPDKTKPSIYYLAEGSLTAVENGYSLRIPVEALSINDNALVVDNIELIIL